MTAFATEADEDFTLVFFSDCEDDTILDGKLDRFGIILLEKATFFLDLSKKIEGFKAGARGAWGDVIMRSDKGGVD
jgi:hypothetical protein